MEAILMLRTSQITKLNKIGKQYLSTSSNLFTSIGMRTSEWGPKKIKIFLRVNKFYLFRS